MRAAMESQQYPDGLQFCKDNVTTSKPRTAAVGWALGGIIIMRQPIQISLYLIFIALVATNSYAGGKEVYQNEEVYKIVNTVLNSPQFHQFSNIVMEPYTEFKLVPPPPPGYNGYDSTMINWLIERAGLRHDELENMQNQISASSNYIWDYSKLEKTLIEIRDLDSLIKVPSAEVNAIRISLPLFSTNNDTMILVFQSYIKQEKALYAEIYKRKGKSWVIKNKIGTK